jgi:hypothetical protein
LYEFIPVIPITLPAFLSRYSQQSITFGVFSLAERPVAELYVNVLQMRLLPQRRCLMDEVNDATLSEEIDRLHAEHRRYAQRLEELLQKPYLSTDEELEEVRLKKLKLHAKDLIYALERRMPVVA